MSKCKLLSAALAATILATPAIARTNRVTSRHVVHPIQVEAISQGSYKPAPILRQQNRNLDPSNYGGELPPNDLEPSR